MERVSYGHLIGSLNERRFLVDFFEKFPNIKRVSIGKRVKDEDRFLWFLSRCTRLTELSTGREFLTQSLLNRLPAVCGPLKVLAITRVPSSGLDLRPVYGLKQLFVLRIDSNDANLDSPLDFVALFESCRYLVQLSLTELYPNCEKETVPRLHA